MDMSNNCDLLCRFLRPCLLVCFVVKFDYFIIKKHVCAYVERRLFTLLQWVMYY